MERLDGRPDFTDCRARCECFTSLTAERGGMFPKFGASIQCHVEHSGYIPDGLQFRLTFLSPGVRVV